MSDGRRANGRWAESDGYRQRGRCLHCRQRGLQLPARGLCWGCYRQRANRVYPLAMETRRAWTAREFRAAVEMAAAGLTRAEIARELGRTPGSVREKLRRAGRLVATAPVTWERQGG